MEYYYTIYQRINEPPTFIGIARDEAIGALLLVLLFWVKAHVLVGLVLAAGWIGFLRYFKQGQGKGWLLSLAYWHLPANFFSFIKATPPSYQRFFIS